MTTRPWLAGAAALAVLLVGAGLLPACGDDSGHAGSGKVAVSASFYPIAWVAEQVGGPDVQVRSVTKPGAEPHDLELTPRDVAQVVDADLVLYVRGFQPAVDDAVEQAPAGHLADLSGPAHLDLHITPIEDGAQHDDEAGAIDPHFWLDPTRLAAVATAIGHRLGTADAGHAADYTARARDLVTRLHQLDDEYRSGLATSAEHQIVTSHNAFGYLARRYGLDQLGITGLTPDQEPSPADLAGVTDYVRVHHVGTIFFESLVSPAIANVVAHETGARTDVLDPLESISSSSQGHDYLEVMRSNLRNLRTALGCT